MSMDMHTCVLVCCRLKALVFMVMGDAPWLLVTCFYTCHWEAGHLTLAEDLGEQAVPPGCLDNSAGCFCPVMLFVPDGSS